MSTLMQASRQWSSRPDEERFLSLDAMLATLREVRANSREKVVASKALHVGLEGADGLHIVGQNGTPAMLTHQSFGQIATLAQAPAGYLRTLPASMAADCVNYGLQIARGAQDVGVLLTRSQGDDAEIISLRAATGPNYGRVWNCDVIGALRDRFGDGVTGAFRVPGEFGRAVEVTKENTTLYASDRDTFVFLADEENRIDVPGRRDGKPGSLARGFFVWNSETGAATLGCAMFLFDYVCCNRIVWGAQQYKELKIRHTASAPEKWLREVQPVIERMAHASAEPIEQMIANARAKALGDRTDAFLAERFGPRMVPQLKALHLAEEGRPIETLWDATTAATAYARSIQHQSARVEFETIAGNILDLAA